jgi:hypothetical protein
MVRQDYCWEQHISLVIPLLWVASGMGIYRQLSQFGFDFGVSYDASMPCLSVEIIGFVDGSSYPAIVECAFVDAEGNRQTFIEKVPRVTVEDLCSDSSYPQTGTVECESVERLQDVSGRRLARVTIDVCDSLDTHRYDATFLILESQLTDCCW